MNRALFVLVAAVLILAAPAGAVAQTVPTSSLTINSVTLVSESTVDVSLTLTCSEEITGELVVQVGPDLSDGGPGYLHHFQVPQPQTQIFPFTCEPGANEVTIPVQTGPEFLPLKFHPGQNLYAFASFNYCLLDVCSGVAVDGTFVVQR